MERRAIVRSARGNSCRRPAWQTQTKIMEGGTNDSESRLRIETVLFFTGVSTLFGRLVIETHSESLVPPSKRRFLATFLQKTSENVRRAYRPFVLFCKPILAILLQRKHLPSSSPMMVVFCKPILAMLLQRKHHMRCVGFRYAMIFCYNFAR